MSLQDVENAEQRVKDLFSKQEKMLFGQLENFIKESQEEKNKVFKDIEEEEIQCGKKISDRKKQKFSSHYDKLIQEKTKEIENYIAKCRQDFDSPLAEIISFKEIIKK